MKDDKFNAGISAVASMGGKARAESLSSEERREIARRAVEARWAKQGKAPVPRATHSGIITLGDLQIECAVLEDGTRLLSQRGFARAVGASKPSSMTRRGAGELPSFLTAENLKPFIGEDLVAAAKPIVYLPIHGGRTAYGIKAEAVPKVCKVWLKARDAGALRHNQEHLAAGADVIIRGLAEVGIVALVDEATGFQQDRARDALAKILEAFIAKELRPWVRTFPPEFYEELCRLRDIEFTGTLKQPRFFGHLTNDIVYKRIGPGVLEELKRLNPANEKGQRKAKHFQWLSQHVGYQKLLQHLAAATALMRICKKGDYDGFKTVLNKALPIQAECPLFDLDKNAGNELSR